MASILLATTNRDKSQILQDLIQDILPERNWVFSNLSTYKNLPDCPETGDMIERAIQKVQFYTNFLHPLDDYIVGSDDGIEIVGFGPPSAMSGELTDAILRNTYPIGTQINIYRAIAVFNTGTGEMRHILTCVPFFYIGSPNHIMRRPGEYPLSHVLQPKGHQVTYAALTPEKQREFTAQNSQGVYTLFKQQ